MDTPHPLGRVKEHDERSRNFPAPLMASMTQVVTKKWRRYGAILDQGSLGSCTGNAAAGCLNHKPFHVVGTKCLHEDGAVNLYSLATKLDGFDGEYPPTDTGSSGLAVAKAAAQLGYITAYQWAFGLDHILMALMSAPLIVGTNWHEDMFYPDANGVVHPTGSVAGGHEYLLFGVDVEKKMLRFQNSWSKSWGVNGHFFMSYDDFGQLINEGGDAVQFVK